MKQEEIDLDEKKASTKQKLAHELRKLAAIFVYLAVFFLIFKLYTRLVLAEYRVNYFEYGLTLLKALALAKIVLTAEALGLGGTSRRWPVIASTFYFAVLFSLFALAFEILEHVIIGWFRGKPLAAVFDEFLSHGWPHFLGMAMVVFVAFLPFFAFRETGRALGEGKLHALFFERRTGPEESVNADKEEGNNNLQETNLAPTRTPSEHRQGL
jgi:hypothetical protein